MDTYFSNQQRQIEELNQKLDAVLEMLVNQSKNDPEELVQANYIEKKMRCSRATGLKYRKQWVSENKLRPIQMPSGRLMYRRSEIDQLLANGF